RERAEDFDFLGERSAAPLNTHQIRELSNRALEGDEEARNRLHAEAKTRKTGPGYLYLIGKLAEIERARSASPLQFVLSRRKEIEEAIQNASLGDSTADFALNNSPRIVEGLASLIREAQVRTELRGVVESFAKAGNEMCRRA